MKKLLLMMLGVAASSIAVASPFKIGEVKPGPAYKNVGLYLQDNHGYPSGTCAEITTSTPGSFITMDTSQCNKEYEYILAYKLGSKVMPFINSNDLHADPQSQKFAYVRLDVHNRCILDTQTSNLTNNKVPTAECK
jgi:hypothetical protein